MSVFEFGITQGDFRTLFESGERVRLLDVRRKPAYDADTAVIPGAQWRDPEAVADWRRTLPQDEPVIAYCVHGHEVSQGVAQALRAAGIDARFLEGGIDSWRLPAGSTTAKPG